MAESQAATSQPSTGATGEDTSNCLSWEESNEVITSTAL